MKTFIVIIAIVAAISIAVLLYFQSSPISEHLIFPVAEMQTSEKNDAATDNSPEPIGGVGANTGTISGKVCYPSEALPVGAIEAKNTINSVVTSQYFDGSENGGDENFEIPVPAGTYILRYVALPEPGGDPIYGYSTDVCTTGLEETCAKDSIRQHNQFIVTSNSKVSNVSLCDFYYSEATDPGF